MTISKSILFVLAVAIAAIGYYATLSPTVEFIDSGELALVCQNLGIAHPTGYPLYAILGRLAAMLLSGSLIFKVNFLSLLFTSLAVGFFVLLITELLQVGIHYRIWKLIILLSAAVFAGFTPLWWAQGTTNEVYSLNLLLTSISIWSLVKYLRGGNFRFRWLLLSVYTLGLSFTNHLSAIYLIPGFLYILIVHLLRKRIGWRDLRALPIFLLAPLTLYIILPLRALHKPFLNWGGVSNIYFFFKHVTGWQYRVWMFSESGSGLQRLGDNALEVGRMILTQLGWAGSVLAVIGIVTTISKHRQFGIFAVLALVMNFIYATNYQISDIEAYFLPMVMILCIFIASALFQISLGVLRESAAAGWLKYPLILLILALPVSNILGNLHKADRSRRTFAERGAADIMDQMEPGAVVIIENWDFYSPWLYLRYAENRFQDRIMLDKELMRRSWYIDFIRRQYPRLYERSRPEFEAFLRQVEPFEKSRDFEQAAIDGAYYGMLHAVVEHESVSGAVYTNVTADQKFTSGLPLVPDGVIFRIHPSDEFLERPLFSFDQNYWDDGSVYRGRRVAQVLQYYRRAFAARALYCLSSDRLGEADYYQELTDQVSEIISKIIPRTRPDEAEEVYTISTN
jgi:hypothetical protein